MTFREKLSRLKRLDDLVLYKWSAGQHRIASNFILLSDLRLNVVACNNGTVTYSSAAPILYMLRGRPVIQFRDHDVMSIINGKRKGINVIASMIQGGEDAIEARYCGTRVVSEDRCPKWLEDKIVQMGTSPTYPVSQLRLPDLFRISKKPETLKPIFNAQLIDQIGGLKTDSTEVLLSKFHNNLDLFGYYTDDGFIISNDYIATGGCCICASKGITLRNGSAVYVMSHKAFTAECAKKHWQINTRLEADNGSAV